MKKVILHRALRLALVDDDSLDRMMVSRSLQKIADFSYEITHFDSGEKFLEALAQEHYFDCVLLDYYLVSTTCIELLETLKGNERIENTAFVLLSGMQDAEIVGRAIEAGARDYLPKENFDGVRLHWTIQNAVQAVRLHGKLQRREKLLNEMSRELEARSERDALRKEMKQRFLANLSHELRTPVAGIIGSAQHLVQSPLGQEQAEFTSVILSCGNSLLALIEDLLTLSEINSPQLQLTLGDFDLAELCKDSVATVHFAARTKSLELKWDVTPSVPSYLVGDAARIRLILVNLLSNAVKFSSGGKVHLQVEGRPQQQVWMINFKVSDQGIGIDDENITQVFKAFHQVDSSFSRDQDGLGLGLALSKLLAEQMGGELTVQSEFGKGSTFLVSLPLKAGSQPEAPSAPLTALPKKQILLVEDNPMIAAVVTKQLQNLGQNTKRVGNGLEAIQVFENDEFDLIFMDCQIPGLDGYATTRRIRTLEKKLGISHPIPIVALTAHALQDERERCLECGMNDFLTKPVSNENLHQALATWATTKQ